MEISTSILSVKEENMTQTFYNLETAKTDYFHIDVMDGKYVEKNTEELMKKYADGIKNISNTPLDVHLMVENIKEYVDTFSACMPNMISFHIEVSDKNYNGNTPNKKTIDIINYIKDANCRVGIAVDAGTDIEKVYKYLPYIHYVLVMSVKAGKGGQKFIEETEDKISKLKKYIDENNFETEIEVDGGINDETIIKIREAGADIAVVGTYLISSKDYKYTLNKLKSI